MANFQQTFYICILAVATAGCNLSPDAHEYDSDLFTVEHSNSSDGKMSASAVFYKSKPSLAKIVNKEENTVQTWQHIRDGQGNTQAVLLEVDDRDAGKALLFCLNQDYHAQKVYVYDPDTGYELQSPSRSKALCAEYVQVWLPNE